MCVFNENFDSLLRIFHDFFVEFAAKQTHETSTTQLKQSKDTEIIQIQIKK